MTKQFRQKVYNPHELDVAFSGTHIAKKKLDYTLLPPEFDDVALVFMQVIESGKYPANDWLKPGLIKKEQNVASIRRHLRDGLEGKELDDESGLDPFLHAATRCLMQYTLNKRAKK